MKEYRIRDWDKHFENNRTRELKRLEWVPVPNKHDGDGFTELLDHENGMAHYGAWHLILQVASKCDPRGTLLRDGAGGAKTPHTPQSLARITRGSAVVFEQAIERLITIGWIESYDNPAPACDIPAPACGKVPMEWKGMEGKEGKGTVDPHAPVNESTLMEYKGAVEFLKLHPAFVTIKPMAIENTLKGFAAYKQHWPKMLREFQSDNAGVDVLKYPPCQALRIAFSRYVKFNNLPSPYQSN